MKVPSQRNYINKGKGKNKILEESIMNKGYLQTENTVQGKYREVIEGNIGNVPANNENGYMENRIEGSANNKYSLRKLVNYALAACAITFIINIVIYILVLNQL